jgi:hypothetical protein
MARTRVAIAALSLALAGAQSSLAEGVVGELAQAAQTAAEPTAVQDEFTGLPVASEEQLDELRGGYIFHVNGVEFRMAVGLETKVGDTLLLRTRIGDEDLRHTASGDGASSTGGLDALVQTGGDPNQTFVIHRVSPSDLSSVVTNRVDGVSVTTVGDMQIEIPNFSQHESAVRQSLAAQGVVDMLDDAAASAIQR